MAIRALNSDQRELTTDATWMLLVEATALPVVTVLLPDGTTLTPAATFEEVTSYDGTAVIYDYVYQAEVVADTSGRWVAVVTDASGATLFFQAFVADVSGTADFPDADELSNWLGGEDAHSFTEQEMTDELAVAAAQQRRRCRIPAAFPPDLREALLRRAARLLYLRKQYTEQARTDGDFDAPPTFPPGRDFTTRDLEAAFLKVSTG
jgi:hypothetical protein